MAGAVVVVACPCWAQDLQSSDPAMNCFYIFSTKNKAGPDRLLWDTPGSGYR